MTDSLTRMGFRTAISLARSAFASLLPTVALAFPAGAGKPEVRRGPPPTTIPLVEAVRVQAFPVRSPVKIDGNLSEWKEARWFQPADVVVYSGAQWLGEEDLSAGVAVCYDNRNLYLALRVTDDVQSQKQRGINLWRGDCVQIALDPLLDRSVRTYTSDDHEMGFTVNDSGGLDSYRWFGPFRMGNGSLSNVQFKINRVGNVTSYEIALPAGTLQPLCPRPGVKCGFNIVVADDDGSGKRESSLELAPGLTDSKNPCCFAVLEFIGDEKVSLKPMVSCEFPAHTSPLETPIPLRLHTWAPFPDTAQLTIRLLPFTEESPVWSVTRTIELLPGPQYQEIEYQPAGIPPGLYEILVETVASAEPFSARDRLLIYD